MAEDKDRTKVNSTAKALKILDCFTASNPEYTLAQLSRIMEMPKSTLLNQLRTLEDFGYIFRSKDTYRIGFKIMELSFRTKMALPIIQYATPFMEDLQQHTGEFIYLTTYMNGMVFYLECLYPARRAIGYSVSGKTLPMHCTGCGKAMLSFMSTDEVDRIISKIGLPKFTEFTITDRKQLMEELQITRKRGYAIDNQEETTGVRCIAMPVRASNGRVAGALSISGSVMAMKDSVLEEYALLLSRACNALTTYADLFPAILISKDN